MCVTQNGDSYGRKNMHNNNHRMIAMFNIISRRDTLSDVTSPTSQLLPQRAGVAI